MKRALNVWLIIIALFCASPALSAPETYKLDPGHTYILWHINHLGYSVQAGKIYAEGTLVLDQIKPKNSKVAATFHINEMTTGLPELDKHLKGELFFDVAKYPTANFVSDSVTPRGKKGAKVNGMLTLHGITKAITLNVTFNKMGVNLITNKPTVGFSATAKIKRSDFNMNTLIPSLGDEVSIDIEAEAFKDK